MATEPYTQAVQPGEENPFGNVTLVQLVSVFPLDICGDDDAAKKIRMSDKPTVYLPFRVRHNRKEGKLVYNPVIDRWRLEEEEELTFGAKAVKLVQPPDYFMEAWIVDQAGAVPAGPETREQLNGKGLSAFCSKQVPQFFWKILMSPLKVDNPDHTIDVELLMVCRCKVKCHERGVRPVQKTCGHSVVLGHRE
jgi:hypothetical protein